MNSAYSHVPGVSLCPEQLKPQLRGLRVISPPQENIQALPKAAHCPADTTSHISPDGQHLALLHTAPRPEGAAETSSCATGAHLQPEETGTTLTLPLP